MGSVLRNKRDGTGLEYKRARVYDPQTGRFTQEDPIGLAGGLNLYGYAGGDPVNFSDPFGLCPWCGVLQRAGAAVSAVGRYGQQLANAVRGWASSPAAQQGAGLVDDLAERVAARSSGAWDVAVAGGRHAGLLRNMAGKGISDIQSGIASLEGRVAEHLGKIRDPSSVIPHWAQLDPRAQQGYLKFWEKEAVNYSQQAEVLRGMLRP
jgi:RHS repeat-associated protein